MISDLFFLNPQGRRGLRLLLLILLPLSLQAEADLGRLVPLGFSVPAERFSAPPLSAWRMGEAGSEEQENLIRKERITLLYFWSSNLPGSEADLPRLKALEERISGLPEEKKPLIAAVNLSDDARAAEELLIQAGGGPALYLHPDPRQLKSYIRSLRPPSAWLIDSLGRVAAVLEGNGSWEEDELVRSLEELALER